jgi:fatty acid desaturase
LSSSATTTRLASDYAELRRIVRAQGLLEPQTAYYIVKLVTVVAMLAAAAAIPFFASHPVIILAAAVFLAFASTQAGLLSHDIIHRQAFRGRRLNEVLRLLVGNLLLGLSHSWWALKHNAHHANPNHEDKDPDLGIPFVVFAADQIQKRPRWTHPLIAIQTVVLPTLFLVQALSMRGQTVHHLAVQDAPRRFLQVVLFAAHFAIYALILVAIGNWWLALGFVALHQGLFGVYNASVFASNHKGMPLLREGERMDFLREQVLTSRDVDGHPLTDFWYGGLNYQIEHHLFPTMPRNNLPQAQKIVREFCAERGIAYESTSLFGAYRDTWRHLHRESASARGGVGSTG